MRCDAMRYCTVCSFNLIHCIIIIITVVGLFSFWYIIIRCEITKLLTSTVLYYTVPHLNICWCLYNNSIFPSSTAIACRCYVFDVDVDFVVIVVIVVSTLLYSSHLGINDICLLRRIELNWIEPQVISAATFWWMDHYLCSENISTSVFILFEVYCWIWCYRSSFALVCYHIRSHTVSSTVYVLLAGSNKSMAKCDRSWLYGRKQ